jgi:hypothetical protein
MARTQQSAEHLPQHRTQRKVDSAAQRDRDADGGRLRLARTNQRIILQHRRKSEVISTTQRDRDADGESGNTSIALLEQDPSLWIRVHARAATRHYIHVDRQTIEVLLQSLDASNK